MSLAVAALRLCALKSLDLKTTAADRVFDSAVDPRRLIGKEPLPAIAIYTDAGRRRPRGRDILGGDCHVDLAIEFFVAQATTIDVPPDQSQTGQPAQMIKVKYPASDAGYENRLRRLSYEVESILSGSNDPWAEMWRRSFLTFSTEHDSEWERGADATSGEHFNFLRNVYRIVPMADPVRGDALVAGGFWKDFFDLADTDDELKDLSLDWRTLVTTPSLAGWQKEAAALGLTKSEAFNTGIAPAAAPADGTEMPPMSSITIDPIGTNLVAGDMTEIVQDSGEGNAPNP